ncbi:hypothetical protein ACWGDS_42785 [Streptomyces sp. NPDC055059]|jgi:multiple sugar transport system substrate-binding protein|uniref:Uncharacterized protein n=1 Tax=Streptomyces sp. NBC_00119 TaxID=2975659 RepID=A0AAU1TYX8_9ACTN|nr:MULTISPECIES: hypothetical protein [unclassified Streptomyces]MCX4648697.1 hypothetical protein [Streptomyces sp. NBC_01446]MCX5323187.1 hypothetical protein [Streptomyces sp. NBC_00120]
MPEPRSGRRPLPRRAVLAAAAVGLSTALTSTLRAGAYAGHLRAHLTASTT